MTKLVYIEWHDAAASIGWSDGAFDAVSPCASIGVLVSEDKHSLVLAGTWCLEDNDTNCRMAIPKGWITKRKVLKV